MKKLFILTTCLLFVFNCKAQENPRFTQCMLVYKSGDTLRGWFKTGPEWIEGRNVPANMRENFVYHSIQEKYKSLSLPDIIYSLDVYPNDNSNNKVTIPMDFVRSVFMKGVEYEHVIYQDWNRDTFSYFLVRSEEFPAQLYIATIHNVNNNGPYATSYYYLIYMMKKPDHKYAHLLYSAGNALLNDKKNFINQFGEDPELQEKIRNKTYKMKDVEMIVHEYNLYLKAQGQY